MVCMCTYINKGKNSNKTKTKNCSEVLQQSNYLVCLTLQILKNWQPTQHQAISILQMFKRNYSDIYTIVYFLLW